QAPDVSRHHAFLEMTKEGWQITDLGSAGGTYWNRKKLEPQKPELWPANETMQIGPYYLHWQDEKPLEEADPQVVNEQMTQLFQVPAGASQRQSVHGRFNAVLYPSLMTLGPGQETTLQIELFNQGAVIDTFKLVVSGLHRSIFSLSQNMLSLAPGARASIPLVIHLPQPGTLLARRIPAGPRPFKLTIQSITFPDEMSVLAGQLTVSPYESFSIGLWPGEIDNGGTCRVLTRNEGNTTTTFSLTSHDKDGRIQFISKQQRVKLEPGDTATQDVTLYYREKPLFGRTRRIPFELEIATDNGTRKTKSGVLNVKPRIPLWVVVFLEMALIFMLALAILSNRFTG
ncbi:MAG TPA: FHA domain-containing protein, partial [Anaerolineae bacterium]|nr:FHA domain-containing protein [Anaerolineae bacterium]